MPAFDTLRPFWLDGFLRGAGPAFWALASLPKKAVNACCALAKRESADEAATDRRAEKPGPNHGPGRTPGRGISTAAGTTDAGRRVGAAFARAAAWLAHGCRLARNPERVIGTAGWVRRGHCLCLPDSRHRPRPFVP